MHLTSIEIEVGLINFTNYLEFTFFIKFIV